MLNSRALRWLTLQSLDDRLAVAQVGELQKQIPLLYALLSVNSVALSYTHFQLAPAWMTVWVPLLLVLASVYRLVKWAKQPVQQVGPRQAIGMMRRTIIFGSLLAVGYISWSLGMDQYGGAREQAHVAIFIAITVIGCIFCLMPLPQAAFAITAIVTLPYLLFYLSRNDPIYTAIAFNIALVTLVMMRVLFNSFHGFAQLIQIQAETERLNQEVTLLAHTDQVTGLPNRRHFFSKLDALTTTSPHSGEVFAVAVIDLDRFKAANDTYGHLVGDHVLQAVGHRLRSLFKPHEVVARLGGDEFGFIIRGDGPSAVRRANMVCNALSAPFDIDGYVVSVGASCGVATTQGVQGATRSLYDSADYALYTAKSESRGSSILFSADHERRIRFAGRLEEALQTADLWTEMTIHLQPIVDVASGRIICVEALARWTSGTLGPISPDIFIPLAERLALINRLTLVLLDKALAAAEQLPTGVKLSFNLSGHDLVSGPTVLSIISIVRNSRVNPRDLIFELTETAVVRDLIAAERSINAIHALGSQIALDDFGTGQSSLGYLHRFAIDKVKLDRSFLAGTGYGQGWKLIGAAVALCHSIDVECVAEGVETSDQLLRLKEIGCDSYQGYLFAKPMPVPDMLALIQQPAMDRALA